MIKIKIKEILRILSEKSNQVQQRNTWQVNKRQHNFQNIICLNHYSSISFKQIHQTGKSSVSLDGHIKVFIVII